MRRISMLLLAFALSSCGLARQQEMNEAQAKGASAAEACKQQFPAGPGVNNASQARCLDGVINAYTRPYYPYPDLLDLFQAKRLMIATQMDKKEIPFDQGNVQIAELRSQMMTEGQRRSNNATVANAAQQQADAASYATFRASMPKTCNRIGNSVTCY